MPKFRQWANGMLYSIIDIETTGNGIKGNRITEIAIFKIQGNAVVDEYTTLVDPECEISYFITGLTGIDNQMVRGAPKLRDIAQRIMDITADTIFVAHNVNFDYQVIKAQFQELGLDFTRKKLCTVRLSRKLVPGLHSYSLGKLCSSLQIPLLNRHRARGDAHATVLLFHKLMGIDGAGAAIKEFLNSRSQEATLPPGLSKLNFDALPSTPGIYYFKNDKREIIYIGKANNIKKRVLGHFYDRSNKETFLCRETAHVDFELSGNELLALLMESAAIKRHYPAYNVSQKNNVQPYGIFTYEDRLGIIHIAYNKLRAVPNALAKFATLSECRAFMEDLCESFDLCPKYCHLQEKVPVCSHYKINGCKGICRGSEPVAHYNGRVQNAMAHVISKNKNVLIRENGRNADEDAYICIRDGIYIGYGFLQKDTLVGSAEDLTAFLVPQKDTLDTQRILKSYLAKQRENVVSFQDSPITDAIEK